MKKHFLESFLIAIAPITAFILQQNGAVEKENFYTAQILTIF